MIYIFCFSLFIFFYYCFYRILFIFIYLFIYLFLMQKSLVTSINDCFWRNYVLEGKMLCCFAEVNRKLLITKMYHFKKLINSL